MFDELAVLVRSDYATYVVEVEVASPVDITALDAVAERAGHVAEDWTATLVHQCKACSEGDVSAHDHPERVWAPRRQIAIAARREPDDELIAWCEAAPTARRVLAVTAAG